MKELEEKLNQLKAKCRPLTNCYSAEQVQLADRMWVAGESLIASFPDHGVNRLIWFAEDQASLKALLELPKGDVFYLEYMTRNPDELREELAGAGYQRRAGLMRMINPEGVPL